MVDECMQCAPMESGLDSAAVARLTTYIEKIGGHLPQQPDAIGDLANRDATAAMGEQGRGEPARAGLEGGGEDGEGAEHRAGDGQAGPESGGRQPGCRGVEIQEGAAIEAVCRHQSGQQGEDQRRQGDPGPGRQVGGSGVG